MSSLLRWIRGFFVVVALVLITLAGLTALLGKLFSGPRYAGAASDHFDGARFQNMRKGEPGGFTRFLKWQLSRQRGPWQERNITPGPKPPTRVGPGELRVTFVNHATVLIQQDGLNVLTDPIWSDRASPVTWVGPKRYHAPGIAWDDLPPIDAVVISHNHYDHMDLATVRRLQEKFLPRIFVGLGNAQLFVDLGIPVTELDWWGTAVLSPEVTLTAVPAQHFANRGLFDRDATLWQGYALKGPAGLSYFAGDTGDGPHFAEIKKRLGAPRLAILPLGAFRPEWFMERVHVSPEQAIAAHKTLDAGTTLGMHFGTFSLGDDGQDEPVQKLQEALGKLPEPKPRFWHLSPGEGRAVP